MILVRTECKRICPDLSRADSFVSRICLACFQKQILSIPGAGSVVTKLFRLLPGVISAGIERSALSPVAPVGSKGRYEWVGGSSLGVGKGSREQTYHFVLVFVCILTKPMIPPDVFLRIQGFTVIKVKILRGSYDLRRICPGVIRDCPDPARTLPGSARIWTNLAGIGRYPPYTTYGCT